MTVFKIKQPDIEVRPSLYFMSHPQRLIKEFIYDLGRSEYKNPELLEFLRTELARLDELDRLACSMYWKQREDKERADKEAKSAAKKKELEGRLGTITGQADKIKALDLIDKLSKLNSGTEIYCEYEIELNRLFRFYEQVNNQ